MSESPTELGRVFIGCDPDGAPTDYEFHPFELKYDWQKRKFLSKEDQQFLHSLVMDKGLIMVGGSVFSFFEVAARFDLSPNGDVVGIERLALLTGVDFVEILK